MPLILQVVLAVSVVVLTVFLALLLVQARRTARSVQLLADSARADLHQIASDVHEVRLQVGEATQLVRRAFELPSLLTEVVAGVVRGLPAFFAPKGGGRFLEALLTGLRRAVHLRRGRRTGPSEEASRG